MKKIILMLIISALIISCVDAAGFRENRASQQAGTRGNVSDITGHEWNLIGVYIDGQNTGFTRGSLPNELEACFTIKFDGHMVSGTGAPNLYSAPYTIGMADENRTISIMVMRQTLMASIFEPENLSEHNFFSYVQNSHSWRVNNGQMELYSKTADNREVRLVFSLSGN